MGLAKKFCFAVLCTVHTAYPKYVHNTNMENIVSDA